MLRRWVDVAAGRVIVWDTRKTTPGYRSLQKAAVRAGGAANHRGNLSDWLMFKDNHLTGTTITAAVDAARQRWPGRTVHVEVDRPDQMLEALEAAADIILLDNFDPEELSGLRHRRGPTGPRNTGRNGRCSRPVVVSPWRRSTPTPPVASTSCPRVRSPTLPVSSTSASTFERHRSPPGPN